MTLPLPFGVAVRQRAPHDWLNPWCCCRPWCNWSCGLGCDRIDKISDGGSSRRSLSLSGCSSIAHLLEQPSQDVGYLSAVWGLSGLSRCRICSCCSSPPISCGRQSSDDAC
ncbi:MAG: hypothetical protein HC849_02710 [Oscillatoriales cyanobacterium RU_3_3]|nr:hypothetical protein [Oscillatoriales cyanobacterium RU_3_3]